MLLDPENVGGKRTEIERALIGVTIHDRRRSGAAPEARRFHLEEFVEPVSAKMVECRRCVRHPFYNGSAGASLHVDQFADDPLDSLSIGSSSSASKGSKVA
ncbi:hypothetical protein [Bradyrhizobium sp. Ash2021]|uniref:hypothetical protein n=1 Tax=Bradyrhizobium sp. Ash2021 TaxID=2954771 RepID=UPI0028151627|nr:hypothetical protein [Bradyrhizobium sp. Ash2021]WMT79683.1 hypothetical protein NL528_45585 [Bradyrhizobium sp. Ash2021]